MGGPYIQSEIVLIRKGNPQKVIIHNGFHYFKWFWDLYKPLDYEPVRVITVENKKYVISRFHWEGTILWTNPVVVENKPIVDFYFGVHTPLILTKEGWFSFICNMQDLTPIEKKFLFHFYLPILTDMLKGNINFDMNNLHGYKEKICDENIPDNYLFIIKDWKCLFIIGDVYLSDDLPESIASMIF